MNRRSLAFAVLPLAGAATLAHAHQPTCDCYSSGDGTITCEAGFSNGADAAGIPIQVRDTSGKVLIAGVTSERSDFSFRKPEVDFIVELNAGENHVVQVGSAAIKE